MSGRDRRDQSLRGHQITPGHRKKLGHKQKVRAARARRRAARELQEQKLVEEIQALSDEQLVNVAKEPIQDEFHDTARRIRVQKHFSAMSLADIAQLSDHLMEGIRRKNIMAKLRNCDSNSLDQLLAASASVVIREGAKLIRDERQQKKRRFEKLRQQAASRGWSYSTATKRAAVLRLCETMRGMTTPQLRDIQQSDDSLRSAAAARVLLGRNNAPTLKDRSIDDEIPDESTKPRWL